jgi:predicted ATPase
VYAGVFLLEELENYETDSVRKEDRKTARRIQELLEKVYTRLGYSIIRVPALPPRERAEFVKKCLEQLND